MTLTLTDFFCGAGGSSTGAIAVPGVEVKVAANHWGLAVEVHNANHQNALHVQADISQYDPWLIPRTDIAWLSPSCTNHSVAQGKPRREIDAQPDLFGEVLPDAAAERSRATMWDVVRYSEHHRYRAVIVENVLEVMKWEPYRAWLLAMDSLGYAHEVLSINSMHAQHAGLPAPQSRDRFYAVFWRRGDRAPDLDAIQRPQAWCPRCERVVESRKSWKNGRTAGRYRAQYVFVCSTPRCGAFVEPGWLPAASAIDWTIPGQRIGDRTKPLAEKTRARIAAGIARYWRDPFVMDNNHTNRCRAMDEPMPTMTTATTKYRHRPTRYGHRVRESPRPRHPVLRGINVGAVHGRPDGDTHDPRPLRPRDEEHDCPRRPRADVHPDPRSHANRHHSGPPVAHHPGRHGSRESASRRLLLPHDRAVRGRCSDGVPEHLRVVGKPPRKDASRW